MAVGGGAGAGKPRGDTPRLLLGYVLLRPAAPVTRQYQASMKTTSTRSIGVICASCAEIVTSKGGSLVPSIRKSWQSTGTAVGAVN